MKTKINKNKKELFNYWINNFKLTKSELSAFKSVKREHFVPKTFESKSYEDIALPILRGKTISQPTTVLIMTCALKLKENEKVFEVGTGSGYQAAIIATIIGHKGKVYSTEVVPELVQFAKQNIKNAKIENIEVFEEDGSRGLEKHAPFDKIIITAACREFPKELIEQLKVGGVIIGPAGTINAQHLIRGTKQENGRLNIDFLGEFIFTPMYGKYGFIN